MKINNRKSNFSLFGTKFSQKFRKRFQWAMPDTSLLVDNIIIAIYLGFGFRFRFL
jgi:hypothetical protein